MSHGLNSQLSGHHVSLFKVDDIVIPVDKNIYGRQL